MQSDSSPAGQARPVSGYDNNQGAKTSGPEVLLLSMPWTLLQEPSLGLGILKSVLEREGIPCTIQHLNILLLKYLKAATYEELAEQYALDDFLFTQPIEGESVAPHQLAALEDYLTQTFHRVDMRSRAKRDPAEQVGMALRIRNEIVPQYLQDCMEAVEHSGATMIGFTCMFDQTFPSLALAKLIKEKHPDRFIIFGGYAVEPPIGPQLMRCFPYLDAVLFGEGEDRIGALARASVDRGQLADIRGLIYRDERGEIKQTPPAPRNLNLDDSPAPDYSDWFRDAARLDSEHQVRITTDVLPVESSRGCWWGQISHCVFCGIDDEAMQYRTKSPDKVLAMLDEMRDRYSHTNFRFSDYILPRTYYQTLLPQLAKREEKFSLHWEMKSNIKEPEAALMREAGVRKIQIGVESLSSSVLKKMAKGVTGIQNVLTIRLLMQQDIVVAYNILFGFPNDEAQEYREICAQIPMLYHLVPPYTYVPVLTTRYAPMQVDPARFGITREVAAEPRYRMVLSEEFRNRTGFKLDDYCYVYETPFDYTPELGSLYDILVYQIIHWRSIYRAREVRLSFETTPDGIEFLDTRSQDTPRVIRFGSGHAAVHALMENEIALRPDLAARLGGRLSETRIAEILGDFSRERLIFEEGQKVVALALPQSCYQRWGKMRQAMEQRNRKAQSQEAAAVSGD